MYCHSESLFLQTYQAVGALINYGVLQMKHSAVEDASNTFKVAINLMKQCGSNPEHLKSLQQVLKDINTNCIQFCDPGSATTHPLQSVELSFNFLNPNTFLESIEQAQYEFVAIRVDTSELSACTIDDSDIFCAILIYNLAICSMIAAQKEKNIIKKRTNQELTRKLFNLAVELLDGHFISQNSATLQLLQATYIMSLSYTNLVIISDQLADEDSVDDFESLREASMEDVYEISSVVSTTWGALLIQKIAPAA